MKVVYKKPIYDKLCATINTAKLQNKIIDYITLSVSEAKELAVFQKKDKGEYKNYHHSSIWGTSLRVDGVRSEEFK